MKKSIKLFTTVMVCMAMALCVSCKKDEKVYVAKVQAETPDVTTTANAADISGTYSYVSTMKSVVIAYGKDVSLSSPQKATAEHTRDSYSVRINNLDPSTKYYYYCIFDTGYGASESEQRSFTTLGNGTIAGHDYVDLGLPSGLLWATCNVGADSPEDYGDYFAWGETETKSTYNWNTYKWCNGSYNTLTKYNTESDYGTVDNKTVLDPEDDAAHVNWGGDWRMPTREEINELKNKCTWTWTTQGGVKGGKFTGPNGESIFLPAAGSYDDGSLNYAGSFGYYWSSSLVAGLPNEAYFLGFDSGDVCMRGNYIKDRFYGLSVRPVCPSQSVSAPTVTTSSVSNITQTTATCGGNVTSDGGATVTARGVCWSTSQNPTVSNSHTTDGSGTGSFTSSITGLTANTTYYIRAYATNSAGTSYGEQKSFTTLQSISVPTVTTSSVSNITLTTATCGGNVISDGGSTVTARGVCWSTSQNPTVFDSHTADGSGTGSFTRSITGLTANTTYYVRAYATNSAGTSYGEQMNFTTQSGGGGGQTQAFTVNGVTFEMIAVEGGTFTMGGTPEQGSDANDNEFPTHSVTLSDYCIGMFEVTQELWLAVMGSWPGPAPSVSYGLGDDYPAYYVSWKDCQEFITELNQLTGRTFRLPTEAEWEYAARGGNMSGGYKYSGSNSIGEVAWYSDNSGSKTHAVGTKSPNELGIYDMSGNVSEWCQDWHGSYSSGSQTDPQGPSSGADRILRGGNWVSNAGGCRVSVRGFIPSSHRKSFDGFRLVLVP